MSRSGEVVGDRASIALRRNAAAGWWPLVLLPIALVWSYWPTLSGLISDWQNDDNYSVGMLVPFAALYLLWQDRRTLKGSRMKPCWWGLGIILLAQAARAFGLFALYESAERYSMVLTVVGLVLLIAGWQVSWRVRWILLFLFLMVPFPGRIHNLISNPLQTQASVSAMFVLELLGVTVIREGNVLVLNNRVPIAVAEACSGLRMMTAFVVVASVLAYSVTRPLWQKAAIVVSSVAVAIVCNLIRLVITAFLFLWTSSELAERFFHDFAGFTMMPMAILILLGELWIMSKLVLDESPADRPGA